MAVGTVAGRVGAPDRDGDGIADAWDPFPDDRDRPGRVAMDTVYANTATDLYRVDAQGQRATRVGRFTFSDGRARSVTDIAADPWGVLWAVSFDAVMVCHPDTARCEVLADTKASLNGLEHARTPSPAGGLALYASGTDGTLYLVTREGAVAYAGRLGAPSSGDLTPLGDFLGAALDQPARGGEDVLVPIDRGSLAVEPATPLPAREIYGLARCDDRRMLAFDAGGAIYLGQADASGAMSWRESARTPTPWWGATCTPRRVGFPGEASEGGDASRPATSEASEASPAGDDAPASGPERGSWCGVR